MTHIAFIGLGNMGGPMAANLVKAGHAVSGFDVVAAARESAKAAGISLADDAASAVSSADIVITMLPTGRHVIDVWGSLVDAARAGSLFVDCSTIDPAESREAHGCAARAGLLSVDAPVSGGTSGAAAATLTFMAGGDAQALDRAEPILALMGKKIIRCGGAGAGQAAKICNNMILGVSMIAVSEAIVLGEALGLTHQALFDVVSTSSGQCWSMTTYCPVPGPVPASPANNAYRPGFMTNLMLKDMTLAAHAAAENGVSIKLGQSAAAMYRTVADAGDGERDFSAIIGHVRAQTKGTDR